MPCRLRDHRAEIEKYLDISYLTPYLCRRRLIDLRSKVADHFFHRKKRIKYLIKAVDKGGYHAYRRFVNALKDSGDEHMGHPYLVSLLEGPSYSTEVASKSVEIRSRDVNDRELNERAKDSKSIEMNILANMPQIVDSLLNGREVLPNLREEHLLTADEYEGLASDNVTTNARNQCILRIIGTKGPTAHYRFAECIKLSSTTVPQHKTLFELISSTIPQKEQGYPNSGILRTPRNIESEGILVSKKYFVTVKELRRLHLRGDFDEAERVVEWARHHNNTELNVALLLESCTAFITKEREDEVIARVTKAEEMCHHITNNNRIILEGRCKWVRGKLNRYLKNGAKADEYISHARSKLFNVAHGEDTALINYCYSVTLLDKVAPDGNCELSDSVFAEAERTLRITIQDAQLGDYGLDLCHPKIRLAQLYLGSSSHRAGTARSVESIDSAQALLLGMDTAKMAARTECMYCYTMSDFYRNKGSSVEALSYAQKALDIATKHEFETEKSSIAKRLPPMESHIK